MAVIDSGSNSAGKANVTANYDLQVALPDSTTPARVGAIRSFSEVDSGSLVGTAQLLSPESDNDYRLRVSQDLILDEEVFNYTAQNTGKHTYTTSTVTNAWTAGNLTTNSANTAVFAAGTGTIFATYATFPATGTQTLSNDCELSFSAQPATNVFIEFGLGSPGAVGVAPTDGVFFRLNSSGLLGVASSNGTESTTGVFPLSAGSGVWAYTNNKKYQFIVYVTTISAEFWVNNGAGALKLGSILLPTGQGRMCLAGSLQFFLKHRIAGGSSSTAIQAQLGSYSVRLGGSNLTSTVSTQGNRVAGSYQGASGGTLGTVARVGTITTGNEANVTAAVPTTTTAALGSGLGGTFWETVSLAANTDGIIMSYQVPAVSVNAVSRRLVLRGMYLSSYVQTVIVGGPYIAEYFLAFGHTAVSLATAESATTKAPRRITLPFTQVVTSAQAVTTLVSQPIGFVDFGDAPVFVNPGEFIQLCTRHIGTAGTTGTIVHRVTPVYGWE